MIADADPVLTALRSALAAALSGATNDADRPPQIVVALSGGLDSVVLLHALVDLRAGATTRSPFAASSGEGCKTLGIDSTIESVKPLSFDRLRANGLGITVPPFQLTALHVHHGLSPQADDWAAFCQSLCASLNVPCMVVRVALPDYSCGQGIEQTARAQRYAAFAAAEGDVLCLAHHQNDQAETLLLNLLRGAGVRGLAGVPPVRRLGDKLLLRPLLDLPRSTLQAWAAARQLRWVEDESNAQTQFRRNYLRHRVLPLLADVFPGAVGVLARTATHLSEQATLLDRLAAQDASACRVTVDGESYLSVARLQTLPDAARRNVLRVALGEHGVQIASARRLYALSQQLRVAQSASEIFVRMGTVGLYVWRDRVWLDHAMKHPLPLPSNAQPGVVDWPDGRLTITAALTPAFKLAPLGEGQRFQPLGCSRQLLSELLRVQGVPPWQRSRLPGLWLDGRLFWVAGLGWGQAAPETLRQGDTLVWMPQQPVFL